MKATELMIGDWVGRVFDDKRIDYRQVDWIRTGEIGMRYQKVWAIGCIEPIPLTPEILEKNGFYDRNTQGYYAQWYYKRFLSNDCFDIHISLVYREIEVSKLYGVGTDCENVEYDSAIVFGNDICVHTLQHALRLCGLNELADNFKV